MRGLEDAIREFLCRRHQRRALEAGKRAEAGALRFVEKGQAAGVEIVLEEEFIDEAIEELFEAGGL